MRKLKPCCTVLLGVVEVTFFKFPVLSLLLITSGVIILHSAAMNVTNCDQDSKLEFTLLLEYNMTL